MLFAGWEGDLPAGQEFYNPLTITMDSDKQITATFKCGIGVAPVMPLAAIGMLGLLTLRRRRWASSAAADHQGTTGAQQ
jgi:hypothetical protein